MTSAKAPARSEPRPDNHVFVMFGATGDLAKGVLVGVLLSTLFFAMKVERIVQIRPELADGGRKCIYHVSGQLFFVSSHAFLRGFDFAQPVERVEIEFTHAHFWDVSAISALDKVEAQQKQAAE